ncbi:MAG: hypothetical protein ACTSXO_04260 [Candidatus Heimdallarchaeota archaeon]
MAEVTDLHVLAKMAQGSPNEEDAFVIRDENGEIITVIHNLRELVDALSDLNAEQIFPSLCTEENGELVCSLALWVHYVLGDAILSAKIFNLVEEFRDEPKKLKVEVFNLCFNRFLNFLELIDQTEPLELFGEEVLPSDL